MKQFISEEIKANFKSDFILEKNPPCPNSIIWENKEIRIIQLLSTWFDYSRKGDQSKNMRPTHLNRAEVKGSWGVGRVYFKVEDENNRIMVIYYDRSPNNVEDRKGRWILLSIEAD